MIGPLWNRLKVVVVGFGIGVTLSLSCVGSVLAKRDPNIPPPKGSAVLLVALGPAAGPFIIPAADLGGLSPTTATAIGVILLALIALHPLRPNLWTGLASGFGIGLWFFFGLAGIYQYAT